MSSKQSAIASLNAHILTCVQCQLSVTRIHALPGEGGLNARLMLIALAPGEKEDATGCMFIGPSGIVLDKLLAAAGIRRESVYMTNLIKCRLPKNRRPKMEEIGCCRPILEKEIAIIGPEVLVPLGYYATRAVFQITCVKAPPARADYKACYGRLFYAEKQTILPLPHPSSLLYNPSYEPATTEKYRKLGVLTQECEWFPACPMKRFHASGRLNEK